MYPIPRMDDCVDSLGYSTVFSNLDVNCSYWIIENDESNRDEPVFKSLHGLYRFVRIPFGLKNLPASFQRAIDVPLSTVSWEQSLFYLEYEVSFSKSALDHVRHFKSVITLL